MEILLVLFAILLIIASSFAIYIVYEDESIYISASDCAEPYTAIKLADALNKNTYTSSNNTVVLFDSGPELNWGYIPINCIGVYLGDNAPNNIRLYSDITGITDDNITIKNHNHHILTSKELKNRLKRSPDKKVYFECGDHGTTKIVYITDIEEDENVIILKSKKVIV